MPKNHAQNKNGKQSGFTILVAVITAGILLIIAMTIGGIALKEQILSTANKDSQIAFYAADTGMECAMYWDQKKGAFTKKADGSDSSTLGNVRCNGASITPVSAGNATDYSYSFKISGIPVGDSGLTTCSIVTITKINDESLPTHIQSRGYNTCAASLTRLERGIETAY
jgi:hypothetical protein